MTLTCPNGASDCDTEIDIGDPWDFLTADATIVCAHCLRSASWTGMNQEMAPFFG